VIRFETPVLEELDLACARLDIRRRRRAEAFDASIGAQRPPIAIGRSQASAGLGLVDPALHELTANPCRTMAFAHARVDKAFDEAGFL
jgi:hypothetical protein